MVSIENLLYSNYIRYDRLTELVRNSPLGISNAEDVNIYIDLYPIIKSLYNGYADQNENIGSAICSSIINMVGHYKYFFSSRYSVDSKVYLVYSNNTQNSIFYSKYNTSMKTNLNSNPILNNLINENLELISLLTKYIPNVYFTISPIETSACILNLITNNLNNKSLSLDNTIVPDIVITKDEYAYQLAGANNTYILRPKKTENGDNSFIIWNQNLIPIYLMENSNKVSEEAQAISPEMLSFIMSLSSVKSRNITKFLTRPIAISKIHKAIADIKISNSYQFDIKTAYELLDIDKSNLPADVFELRWKAIDIVYQSRSCPLKIDEVNLYDPKILQKINNEYFINNPLDLNKL